VQAARKSAGLDVEDRIELALEGDDALERAAATHRDYIAGETLAVSFELGDGATLSADARDHAGDVEVDGLRLTISLRRLARA
jgi:isoleucyl-tRNA synthetase